MKTETIQLPEVIDEWVDLKVLLPKGQPEIRVDCAEVKRINSVGIRNLKAALTILEQAGARVIFEAVTPPLVEATHFVSNLLPSNARIESVFVPYCCPNCTQGFMVLYQLASLREKLVGIENEPCVKCGKNAKFDHVGEIYFGALFGSKD